MFKTSLINLLIDYVTTIINSIVFAFAYGKLTVFIITLVSYCSKLYEVTVDPKFQNLIHLSYFNSKKNFP